MADDYPDEPADLGQNLHDEAPRGVLLRERNGSGSGAALKAPLRRAS